MTIISLQGSIFETPVDITVIPVNTVGVAGAGLAKAWKSRDVAAVQIYAQACRDNRLTVDSSVPLLIPVSNAPHTWWLPIPTKRDWRTPSTLAYVQNGLSAIAAIPDVAHSVSIPALGCGRGGLDWEIVKPYIYATADTLSKRGKTVYIFPPRV